MIPEPIRVAYATRVSLTQNELCKLLHLDVKTLRAHIKEGNIHFLNKGLGKVRQTREFTLAHVLDFLQRRSQICQSSKGKPRRTTTTTSFLPSADFQGPLHARQSGKAGPSNARGGEGAKISSPMSRP